jgi:hypothetical protein
MLAMLLSTVAASALSSEPAPPRQQTVRLRWSAPRGFGRIVASHDPGKATAYVQFIPDTTNISVPLFLKRHSMQTNPRSARTATSTGAARPSCFLGEGAIAAALNTLAPGMLTQGPPLAALGR